MSEQYTIQLLVSFLRQLRFDGHGDESVMLVANALATILTHQAATSGEAAPSDLERQKE
jgi:hypothetical protein